MKVTQQGNLNTDVVQILAGMEGYTLYSFELNFCMKFQSPRYDCKKFKRILRCLFLTDSQFKVRLQTIKRKY